CLREGGARLGRVRTKPGGQHRGVGRHIEEGEAPPQRLVDECNRAVGGVHGADQVQVGGELKALLGVGQPNRLLAVFEQVEQLAEDTRQVAAVDLVDNK